MTGSPHFYRIWLIAIVFTLAGLAFTAAPALACGGGVLCVDADATDPTPDGLSWTTAFTNVQDALNVAASGNEIWVAEGVYYPDEGAGQTGNARSSTFGIVSGVALYGGFAATETLRIERDRETHLTVLSGDLEQNDTVDTHGVVTDTTAIIGSNAYHVVTTFEVTDTTTLDGFTVTAGYADGTGFPDGYGGGMLNYGDFSGARLSTPQVNHVIFSGNYAGEAGGGMVDFTLEGATLTDITFVANRSGDDGGGLAFYHSGVGSYRDSRLEGLTFERNVAASAGGGMFLDGSSPAISNTTFVENTASAGGGMFSWTLGQTMHPALANTTFLSNTARSFGGGLASQTDQVSSSSITLTDVTFTGNETWASGIIGTGGGMYHASGPATLTRVVFENNVSRNYGGGFHLENNGSATLNEVSFIGNTADNGGGICIGIESTPDNSTLTLTRGVFIHNRAWFAGSGMMQAHGDSTLVDVMFSQNTVDTYGGGVSIYDGTATLLGVTMANNTAGLDGGGLYVYNNGNATLANSILWGNSATQDGDQIQNDGTLDITYSDIQESGGGGNNLDADPLFIDAANDDLRLSYLSPAIDAGNSLSVTTGIDLAGNPRIVGAAVDMGAYELAGPIITLQKSVTPTQGVPYHGVVTYTLALANVGVQSDTVTLTDTLPDKISFGGWVSQPAGTLRNGNTLTWTGAITAEETITLAFTATHSGSTGDIITNTAYFSGTGQTGHNAATFALNQPPSANAGVDRSVMQGELVQLDGSGSSDSEGSPLTYTWSQTGGPAVSFTPTLSITTFTAPSNAEVLTFTLAVTDTGGLADTDEVVVTVEGQRLYLPLIWKQ
ncbi:MAG: hypothetical protein JXM69_14485 [Anaerolineae bacterium]|nr:hypothetical protein [Anaerolineae bacterium]